MQKYSYNVYRWTGVVVESIISDSNYGFWPHSYLVAWFIISCPLIMVLATNVFVENTTEHEPQVEKASLV